MNIEEAMTLAARKAMNWNKEYVIYKSPDGPFYHVDLRGVTPPKGYTEVGTVHPASRKGKTQ